MKILFDSDDLKLAVDERDRELPSVICFTGVGMCMGAIDIQKNEFTKNDKFYFTHFYISFYLT